MDGLVALFAPVQRGQPLRMCLIGIPGGGLTDSQPGPDIQEKAHDRHDCVGDTGDDHDREVHLWTFWI